MPKLDVKLLVLLSPFVNADLFKKGLYHIRCRVRKELDPKKTAPFGPPCDSKCDVLDSPSGMALKGAYPMAFIHEETVAVTKTLYIQYVQQNFVLSDWFVLHVSVPVNDLPHALPQPVMKVDLVLDLCLCETEKTFNVTPDKFSPVSTRTVTVDIGPSGTAHGYTDVFFDFGHMAAIGVNVHAAVVGFDAGDVKVPRPATPIQEVGGWRSFFRSKAPPEPVTFPSFGALLFGETDQPTTRAASYEVPTGKLVKACEKFEQIWNLLRRAHAGLKEIVQDISSHHSVVEVRAPDCAIIGFPVRDSLANFTTTEDFSRSCDSQLTCASASVARMWSQFCSERVCNQALLESFIYVAHRRRISYMLSSTVDIAGTLMGESKCAAMAKRVRNGLEQDLSIYCRENTEECAEASVIFVEEKTCQRYKPPPASIRESVKERAGQEDTCPHEEEVNVCSQQAEQGGNGMKENGCSEGVERTDAKQSEPDTMEALSEPELLVPISDVNLDYSFTDHTHPYLLCSVTGATGHTPSPEVHLLVFLHGLDGHPFDLRLYKTYFELALPQVTFDFLMAQANQKDTFCDFEIMTDRVVDELQHHLESSMVQPTHISFVGHSLGSIVVRNMLTRPEMVPYLSKMHTLISLCAPHLGTTQASGYITAGMWFLQKWRRSQSLLQLSLRDNPNPRETFLYRLSQKPSLEHFRNVLLISSHQDKYVPFHSARLEPPPSSGGEAEVCSEMLLNITQPMQEKRVNVVRYTVEHALATSTNSLIGRAAHIAMLDDEKFVEKFAVLHCSRWFT